MSIAPRQRSIATHTAAGDGTTAGALHRGWETGGYRARQVHYDICRSGTCRHLNRVERIAEAERGTARDKASALHPSVNIECS